MGIVYDLHKPFLPNINSGAGSIYWFVASAVFALIIRELYTRIKEKFRRNNAGGGTGTQQAVAGNRVAAQPPARRGTGLVPNNYSARAADRRCTSTGSDVRVAFDRVKGRPSSSGCAICLEEYKENEKRATIRACGHRFHSGCVLPWVMKHNTCPLCRSIV